MDRSAMSNPELPSPALRLSVIVCTYQRPGHLRRCLLSLASQQGVHDPFEVIVADDGSTDETPQVVADFARSVTFPVQFISQPHAGFQLSRIRNRGVAHSRGSYLLFLDGDCILPPDHLQAHLDQARPGWVQAGARINLDPQESERCTSEVVQSGAFVGWGSSNEWRAVRKLARKAWFYQLIHHPTKPKIMGCNIGICRADYERINGFDENFVGWGGEDDDLCYRFRAVGVRVKSIIPHTLTYHLWHPTDPTAGSSWRTGPNIEYLLRRGRLSRCRQGLVKREQSDLAVRITATPGQHQQLEQLAGQTLTSSNDPPEIELLVAGPNGKFTSRAEVKVLIALVPQPVPRRLLAAADVLIGEVAGVSAAALPRRRFALAELAATLATLG